MAVMDFTLGQAVQIPAIQLTDGTPLAGIIRATQGDTVAIELEASTPGTIPARVDSNCMLTWKIDGLQRTCPILVRSKSQRALVAQVAISERREAPRLRAEIRLVYEVIPPEQVGAAADEVMAKVNTLGEPVSETVRLLRAADDPIEQIRQEIAGLRNSMDLILQKLDQLTNLVLSGEKPRGPVELKRPLSIGNCSSTGIGFMADYDLQLFTRRSKHWEFNLGDTRWCLEQAVVAAA
jgi:hypothetical protein